MAALSDATRQQFINLNLSEPKYRQLLSESDYKHFLNLQLSIRAGGLRAEAAGDRRLQQREETTIIKQAETSAKKSAAAAAAEKLAPGASKFLPPAPRVTVPQWMLDSAAHDPEYRDYLKMHGVPLTAPTDSAAGPPGNIDLSAPAPKVPGAPIQKFLNVTPLPPRP
jgi:hypothetical protein